MNGLPHVLIMAGGTGGHVFPALAVAETLVTRGVTVSWLGTRKGMESAVVTRAGFAIDYISVAGLRGNGLSGWVMAPFRLIVALIQAISVVRRRRPAVVLGMGGFVTGPGGLASWLLRRPLVIHEQNSLPGLTNRLLAPFSSRVLQAFPGAFKRSEAETVGNPLRQQLGSVCEPESRFDGRSGPIHLLVVGGSLGALSFNRVIPEAVASLPSDARPLIRHQGGARHHEVATESYRNAGVEADVTPFIDDMADAYGWADLVICRAGALTISELADIGVAAILIPYPYAVDDHQTKNGEFLVSAGAARMINHNQFDANTLAALLSQYCLSPQEGRKELLTMARTARRLATPLARARVAEICLEVAQSKR